MVATAFFIIAMFSILEVIILGCCCLSYDFLLFWALKYDKKWAKKFKEHQSDFLRWKHRGENTGWGL